MFMLNYYLFTHIDHECSMQPYCYNNMFMLDYVNMAQSPTCTVIITCLCYSTKTACTLLPYSILNQIKVDTTYLRTVILTASVMFHSMNMP